LEGGGEIRSQVCKLRKRRGLSDDYYEEEGGRDKMLGRGR